MIRLLISLICVVLLAPGIAEAQALLHIPPKQPVTLNPESALILYRTDVRVAAQRRGIEVPVNFDFVLVYAEEILGSEAGEGDSNTGAKKSSGPAETTVFQTSSRKIYERSPDAKIYMAMLPAGRYVIAAVSHSGLEVVGTCLCMGTVEFEAKAGVVTDLGYLLAVLETRPTSIPELTNVTPVNFGSDVIPIAATVRPPREGMPVPEALNGVPIVPADYKAVGKFPNYFHTVVSRMAPIEGVLAYEEDRVIDLKAR